jgi:D-beta-D-heptose 7-phosphate kinase/D-beta-D-heptose 1-phosphate adenosyltransferase
MKVICTSGFFNPIHIGHLECLESAKKQGDYLLVFVDSDRKAIIKNGYTFMHEEERLKIVKALKCVDEAVIIDTSIAEALEKYKPNVFFKGGDRTIDTLPKEELDVCAKNNIQIICEGEKIQASSSLIDKTSVIKPWGKYNVLHQGLGFVVKKLTINPHCKISLQYHNHRSEYWTVQKGIVNVIVNENITTLRDGGSIFVPEKAIHRIMNHSDDIAEIIEVQYGKCDELDIVRIGDDYNRI